MKSWNVLLTWPEGYLVFTGGAGNMMYLGSDLVQEQKNFMLAKEQLRQTGPHFRFLAQVPTLDFTGLFSVREMCFSSLQNSSLAFWYCRKH